MRLKNCQSNLKRLITFISLNYKHQFIGSLHAMDMGHKPKEPIKLDLFNSYM